ncbi:MAG: DEAD/DEAH box helicase, partial [Anaerolineae bacterium]|nr:DEAD/DEAH box helicase [Phycisphaerae bacterium]
MSILNSLVEQFSHEVRKRGTDYFVRGAVRIVDAKPGRVRAQVTGGRVYRVEIDFDDDDFTNECSCPYYEQWGECKHIWATILQSEREGLLGEREHEPQNPSGDAEDDAPESDEGENGDLTVDQDSTQKPSIDDLRRQMNETSSKHPGWKTALRRIRSAAQPKAALVPTTPAPFPMDRRIVYLIDLPETHAEGTGMIVELATQKRRRDGGWDRPKQFALDIAQWMNSPDETDRVIAQMLVGARDAYTYYMGGSVRRFTIPGIAYDTTLKLMCGTGRCGVHESGDQFVPLKWDEGAPWEFVLEVAPREDGERVALSGSLRRGQGADAERMTLTQPKMLLAEGLFLMGDRIERFNHGGAWPIFQAIVEGQAIHAAPAQAEELVRELAALPRLPKLDLHPSINIEPVDGVMKPRLTLRRNRSRQDEQLLAEISFEYAGHVVGQADIDGAIYEAATRKLIRRNRDGERFAMNRLTTLGVRNEWTMNGSRLVLPTSKLHPTVMALTLEGWDVQAEGSLYRRPGEIKIQVGSGIDWFELNGGVEFEGQIVTLPKLLAAVQRGESTIKLDDGSVGLMPMEWLNKYAPLAGVGEADGDMLRFARAQVGLLDALLMAMPEARVDETFTRARQELRAFEKIEPIPAPAGFVGTLRPYQNDGLGWLMFLERFGFGGCLADDMGLGKTVMVLALLEARRQANSGPSLVVVPRSLVFNWMAEANRFAPQLRLLDHSGINRTREVEHFSQHDLVITTYGTLRRDAAFFKDITFDYVILDEAQAIKNANTEAAKAARLLRGKHRLALSGTPIENRLAELWSLFEFLNPGMLGAASVFRNLIGNGQELEGRETLSRALRPFILRRTKAQVAKELPEKLEQTIHCDLEPKQRKLYDELREHYRQALLGRIATVGLNKSKIQVLEALLRLRQAACHPGLIDKTRVGETSAKLDALMLNLEDVLAEGHKALVFSQFTSMLAIVRKRLDDAGTPYEYLDGKTRDRQARVERFQSDENCKLFLISLKAGGVGLNLTAADYVFLLDPWWNPAVEAQAIDRTHRIGQTRRVFAYRLIARDTVEEKVLQLQQTKRDLADAIITADNSLISSLGRED